MNILINKWMKSFDKKYFIRELFCIVTHLLRSRLMETTNILTMKVSQSLKTTFGPLHWSLSSPVAGTSFHMLLVNKNKSYRKIYQEKYEAGWHVMRWPFGICCLYALPNAYEIKVQQFQEPLLCSSYWFWNHKGRLFNIA